jgi:hypothetical protein
MSRSAFETGPMMPDDARASGSTGDGAPRPRRELPAWLRDATRSGETGGFTIVGGFPPEFVERLEARDTATSGETGRETDPVNGPATSTDRVP